jgi:hypothetical protein
MTKEDANQARSERVQKLLAWVNEGYRNALRLYGASHPLTQSWLKEKLDIEWFSEKEEHGNRETFA